QIAAPTDGDALDQVDDVALTDAADGAPAPGRQHNAVESALGGPSGRGASLTVGVEFEEGSDCSLDRIPTPTPLRKPRHKCHRCHSRLGLKPVAVGRNLSPRAREREPAIAGEAERHLFGFAPDDIALCPATRADWLNDQVQPRQPASGYSARAAFGRTASTNLGVMTFPITASSRAG